MKLSDLIIIFVIMTIPFQFVQVIKSQNIDQAVYREMELNHLLDRAVEDATSMLIDQGNVHSMLINKERALESFYTSLFVNLDIVDDKISQDRILGYIPIVVICDYDGFYALSQEVFIASDGYSQIESIWKPKVYYTFMEERFVYNFTLDDFVTVYDKDTNSFFEGYRDDLKTQIPESALLHDANRFDQVRRRCITQVLQEEMTYYINKHNDTARYLGITYNFYLPDIEKDGFANTMDDIGIIAFFQGMPLGSSGMYYNHYAFGGAQIIKKDMYYLQEESNGITYYHREQCVDLVRFDCGYTSPAKCALEGAFPCDKCKP